MERFQMLFIKGMKARLEREMGKHGFNKVAPFIRYIIENFLNKQK